MKKLATILLVAILIWPVSVMAGCGDGRYYPKEGIPFRYVKHFGCNVEDANIPGLPPLTAQIFNLPNWIKLDVNYVTSASVARNCKTTPEEIRISIPPDCNARAVTDLGDPNKCVFKAAIFSGTAPTGSKGIYTGELRVMGDNTITAKIVFDVNESQVLFFVEDCNE